MDSRYYNLPAGCVRGNKCLYAHSEEEEKKRRRASGNPPRLLHSTTSDIRIRSHVGKINDSQGDLTKKVFVGGLPSSVESDNLREFFEKTFGPVVDAVVIEGHMGDQVHSRGFGFVTFENEKSVVSAVNAHFVSICGKTVEIKSAVPRCGRDASKSDVTRQRMLDFSLPSVDTTQADQGQNDTQGQYWMKGGWEDDTGLSMKKEAACANTNPTTSCSPASEEECISWMPKFEEWLPKFLLEVFKRLKEGEWYPLSSLKGDFRATCGLELHHEAIGFHKLKDFIRSLPHLCRIKIVPVGLGPATHIVLLPAGSRLTTRTCHPIQEHNPTVPRARASLVETDPTHSYGAAICRGTTSSDSNCVTCGSVASGKRILAERNVNTMSWENRGASVSTVQNGAACNGLDSSVKSSFLRPRTLLETNSGKDWDRGRSDSLRGQTPNCIHPNCLQCTNSCVPPLRTHERYYPSGIPDSSDSFMYQEPERNSPTQAFTPKVIAREKEGLKNPLEQLTQPHFTYFKHEHIAHPYSSRWEHNVPRHPEKNGQHSSSGNNWYLPEESQHGLALPRVEGKLHGPLQNPFFFHPDDEYEEQLKAAQTFGYMYKR